MLSHWVTDKINDWMRSVVVIRPDDTTVTGEYDGYGRVYLEPIGLDDIGWVLASPREEIGDSPGCWHLACWGQAGEPVDHVPSSSPDCQGFFCKDCNHAMACPK
jgi:hypothetical protein